MTQLYRDRYYCTISNTPGTGSIIISSAVTGTPTWLTFGAADDGGSFDILIQDGSNWEIDSACLYTNSTTTLTRGTFISSSTGSTLSASSSATVAVVLTAERYASIFNPTITTPLTNQVLQYNGTTWVNATPSSGSSIPDYVSISYFGGL